VQDLCKMCNLVQSPRREVASCTCRNGYDRFTYYSQTSLKRTLPERDCARLPAMSQSEQKKCKYIVLSQSLGHGLSEICEVNHNVFNMTWTFTFLMNLHHCPDLYTERCRHVSLSSQITQWSPVERCTAARASWRVTKNPTPTY